MLFRLAAGCGSGSKLSGSGSYTEEGKTDPDPTLKTEKWIPSNIQENEILHIVSDLLQLQHINSSIPSYNHIFLFNRFKIKTFFKILIRIRPRYPEQDRGRLVPRRKAKYLLLNTSTCFYSMQSLIYSFFSSIFIIAVILNS